jgi:hypothetical protein
MLVASPSNQSLFLSRLHQLTSVYHPETLSILAKDGSWNVPGQDGKGDGNYVRFEVFTVVTEEWHLLGCYAMWLL